MILHTNENMWDFPADWYFVTANSTVYAGALVMGAGAAGEAKRLFPGIDTFYAPKLVQWRDRAIFHLLFGYVGVLHGKQVDVGLFQTKDYWQEDSKLEIIEVAAKKLASLAKQHSQNTFALNYPGIGLGGLTKEQVSGMLEVLPDNVHVFER